jgi:NMD protein affecting ribosome stability and mRNA decay
MLTPCSACGVSTDDIELSQEHRLCSECYRNYEQ